MISFASLPSGPVIVVELAPADLTVTDPFSLAVLLPRVAAELTVRVFEVDEPPATVKLVVLFPSVTPFTFDTKMSPF